MPALVLDAVEARLLGVLVEKETTTPDAYPLSLNALQNGANQKSNRDPRTNLSSHEIEKGLARLRNKGLASASHAAGARVEKYKHTAGTTWELDARELAVLAELVLRGAQQPGELRTRASRMARIESLPELDAILDTLRQRGFVQRLDPLPGSRAARWDQIVAAAEGEEPAAQASDAGSAGPNRTSIAEGALPLERASEAAPAPEPAPAPTPAPDANDHEARIAALEREVAELRDLLDGLTS